MWRTILSAMSESDDRSPTRQTGNSIRSGPPLDSLQAGCFRIDRDGRFVEVNGAWLRMHGYESPAEVLGEHFSLTQLEPDMAAAQKNVEALLGGAPIPTGEFTRRCKDGSIGYHVFSANPVVEQGLVTGLEGFLIDVTEQKRLEILYRNTVEFAPVGMHFYRLEPDGNLLFMGANQAGDHILGIDTTPFIGQRLEAVFPPMVQTNIPERYRHVALTGEKWRKDEIVYEHGQVKGVFDVVAFQTEPRHMVAMFTDITVRKQAEETLRRSRDQLESLVRERTTRLRGLASQLTLAEHRERRRIAEILHEDLQQRLVAIRYRISMIAARKSGSFTPKDAEELQDELAGVIELSRDLTTQLRPPVLYDLGMEAVMEWLAGQMQSRFGLVVHLEACGECVDASDNVRILAFEATRELLMNVVKHAGIREASVRLWCAEDRKLAIEVSDNGRGFDASQGYRGSEFGLFSVRERIEALGGEVNVETHPGKGTCVRLLLPTA